METSAVDELYGGLDQGHHDSIPNYDEDSVDIYSGLEDSPKKNYTHGKKDSTYISPKRVKESLDLYEELITQEREEKDTTYNELKSQFVAAQNQVQDLLSQLQQIQTKNSSLHHENILLKKNICALIKTAKMEIIRKDEEINKLSKRSSRNFHSSAKERSCDSYNRSSASLNNLVGPIRESQDLPGVKDLSEACQGRDSSLVISTPSGTIEDPLNRRKGIEDSLNQLPNAATQDHRLTCSGGKEGTNLETSTTEPICDETDQRKREKRSSKENAVLEKSQNKLERNRSEREDRGSARSSSESSNSQRQQQDDLVTPRGSGRSRSPSENAAAQIGKEESCQKQKNERLSRTEVSDGGREKSSSGKVSHRSTEKRGTRDHHRKEERRQDGMSSSERRHSRSDLAKDYQHKKTLGEERSRPSEKSTRGDRSNARSETIKEHKRQDAEDSGRLKGLRNDGKDRSHTDSHENRWHASPHRSSQNPRKDKEDRRRTSGRSVESSRSKTSSSHDDSRGYASSHRHGGSKERSDKVKVRDQDQGSKNTRDNTSNRKMTDYSNVQEVTLKSARIKSPTRLPASSDSSGMPEESSPKSKLSFMETLNLTISPIKKQCRSQSRLQEQTLPHEPVQLPPEDPLTNKSTEEGSLFCVVDEQEGDSMEVSLALPANATAQHCDTNPPRRLEIKVKELEIPKGFDGNLNESLSGKVDGNDSEGQEEESVDGPSVLLTDVGCNGKDSQVTMSKDQETSVISAKNSGEEDHNDDTPGKSTAQNDAFQEDVATSIMPNPTAKTCLNMDNSVSLEVVSDTICVNTGQCKETLADSDMKVTNSLETSDPCPSLLKGPSAGMGNINTTGQVEVPEQTSSSEPDSAENETTISKPSCSTVVPQDEDSMMLTLRNIKVIPEAISPLTSPIRQIKKSQQPCLGKEVHVKSLNKDFTTAAAVANNDAVKRDMNKENKSPDSLATPNMQKDQQEPLPSTASEEDLEEGEIISESDGECALVIQSPPGDRRSGLRNQSSPRSPSLQQKSSKGPVVAPRRKVQEKKAASKDSPPSNKRRFKTVAVPPKAKISTCAEFMNMLLFIRSELRRKYMKLHKNVTKPAFCCIVEMSQASFAEYVDGVNFDKFCSQGSDIKARLNKIIQSVMSKVSNNGIVNRIFDQQAEDSKQKLWNFVDSQFDFLFKELKAALKSPLDPSKNKSCLESKQPNNNNNNNKTTQDLDVNVCKLQTQGPLLNTTENRPHKKAKDVVESEGQKVLEKTIASHSLPCSGLGSCGKNIKATVEEGAMVPTPILSSEKSLQEIVPAHENKTSNYTRRLSHSGSIQDRADFEILTEQQTSSLTFNLVSDSQMGDIFRCLLQGSDLLETVDSQNWPLSTPRKEGQAGENLLGLMTPSKMMTPSKLITTWSSISPYKFPVPLNPALLDENCMLEVPCNAVVNQCVPAVATASSQQPYSILAEDLAVSMTVPSPLKSDSHLSFLHPVSSQSVATPSTVISAHYSEDALLDGEDATEQDIHLSLETDNSSSPSSTSGNWDTFQFKPNLPMQAEVMERSNDHFIVRIRQTCPGTQVEPAKVDKGTLPNAEVLSSQTPDPSLHMAGEAPVIVNSASDGVFAEGRTTTPPVPENQVEGAATSTDVAENADTTESERAEKSLCQRATRKRKTHHSGPKAKRQRREKSQDEQEKRRYKKNLKSSKERDEKTPSKKIKSPSLQLSPNSLSAKNVIKKKGEVVVTWTRVEDRDILVTLKTKGASFKTFAALATKLRKSQAQIEERFTQLMKLFKKKEKMES